MPDLQTVRELMKPWLNAQQPMAETPRWGNFPDYGQTLGMHNSSIPLVMMSMRTQLLHHAPRLELDWLLLDDTVKVHDQGEPLTGGDEHAGITTADKPVREWTAFEVMVRPMPSHLQQRYVLAFTLPYIRKPSGYELPPASFWAYNQLSGTHQAEATFFDAVERVDYLFSAIEGHDRDVRNPKETMIEHTVGNQVHKLDALVDELPALKFFWTPTLREQLLGLAA